MLEVSPSTAVGTRGSLGTVGGNTVRTRPETQGHSNVHEDLKVSRESAAGGGRHVTRVKYRHLKDHFSMTEPSHNVCFAQRGLVKP